MLRLFRTGNGRRSCPSRVSGLSVLLVLACASSISAADPGIEFFEKKIRPVLVEQCYSCHSAEAKKQKGGLLLDTRAGIRKGGESGPAVVPVKPKDSLILKAIRYNDENMRMPPKGKLSEAAIRDFEEWIAMGAPDPREDPKGSVVEKKAFDLQTARKFWAYQPPRRHPAPNTKDQAWPRTDIDRFILAKLESKNLKPFADADRTALIRRAYFDLIGLPPTPAQIDAFVNDPAQDAFVKVVDELLASPHFGERWGRHWLDIARFSESSGGGRSLLFKDAWRYRDYVIDAFNQDRPYDRFIREQIAGDLMTAATPEERRDQIVATAFLVLGPTNYEEQDKDVLEMDVVDEQIDTMGRVFLGMTIGCARCHDHKFDPIPTADYYALAGIMKSTQTLIHDNVSKWVDLPLPMKPDQEAAVKKFDAAVADLKHRIQVAKESEKKAGKTVASVSAKGKLPLTALPGIVLDDSQANKVGSWMHSRFSGSYIGDGYLHDENKDKGEKTLTFVPQFPSAGRYEVRLAYVAGTNRSAKVPVTVLHAEGEQTIFIDESTPPPIDGRFISIGTFRFEKSGQNFVMVSNEGTTGHVVVDAVQLLRIEGQTPEKAADAKPASAEKVPAVQESKKLEEELKKLTENGPPRPLAMSVKEAAKIEDCQICIRGNTHNRGEKVARGYLQVATAGTPAKPPDNQSGRRELADWLANPTNPLTARVMVNRIWHYLFGAGIVRTVDVFGSTGELPSHPELLDYLAIEFMSGKNGDTDTAKAWSIKKMIRMIMLSRTYQLSCGSGKDPAVDPENRLLAHMNRRRLDAEAIRDTILVVSGQLDRTMGGPTTKKGTSSEFGYQFDDTRRSVYTPIFRNRLLELFEAFDFADPNLVYGKRNVSTVATQALYLMNSPFIMEQSRHAATAALAQSAIDDATRIERAYRIALGRLPSEREKQLAIAFVSEPGAASPEKRLAAWERFYQSLFSCIDFRYVN